MLAPPGMGPVATLTPDPSSPSPTPSPASLRQWRPAAQRNLRNQWSRLLAAKARWLAAATDGRSHASALVNAHLSRSYMPGMDLGVLKDMPGIRDRASTKLARKEEQCRGMLLSAYKEMVLAVCDLVKASRAMRCFSKISSSSPLVRFTDHQDDLNDSGDGGGAPVYKWFSMLEFESLAQELIEMFVSELHLKRLIVLELLSINLKEGAEEHHPSLEWSDELYDGELYEFQGIGFRSGDSFPLPENWSADVLQARRPGHTLSHDVLQVYLTSWLANVNIKMSRAIFILTLMSVPLAFVLGFTGQILIALGQNPEISYEAGLYARWLIPGLFAYGLLQCLTKFLQAQNVVHPLVVCSGVTLVLHILLCWFLVQYFGLGNRGAALATSISYWFNVILLGMYVKLSEAGRRSWHGWSREVLKDVNMYLRLAIPSTFMTCLEYWAFEMVVLLAGFLPNPKLETSILSISLNTMWMVYTIPSGLSSAISIRVSNELGAGNPQAACLSILISGTMSLTEGLLVVIITFSIRDVWGYLYSNEEEVVKYVSTMMPILATSDFMDGIQCTLSGAARGCGWQKACSFINLCSYYAIGIPSAIIFAFVLKIGGKGLWLGIICAMAVQILALLVMMLRTSWDKEAEKALARTRVQGSDGRRTLA